ncbi:MAG TPA: bacterial Ig-like domain-containing protein [Candidatus Limihabitans stercoravium]|nr:bacterial Ig-like domain-containing protein [Candidatus Limihabitans stercoravium]
MKKTVVIASLLLAVFALSMMLVACQPAPEPGPDPEPGEKTLVDIELRVVDGFTYMPTMEIYSGLEFREKYSDGSFGDWYGLIESDIKSYSMGENTLDVVASIATGGKTFEKTISVPLDNEVLTVAQLAEKEAGDKVYLVKGMFAGVAYTLSRTEFLILDNASGKMMGVKGLNGGGAIADFEMDMNGLQIGDELCIPVKLTEVTTAKHSDTSKIYAEFAGGTLMESAIISKGNTLNYHKENAVEISSQEQLVKFLSPENRVNNFYKVVKLHGTMQFIYYSGGQHYRFFLDPSITSYEKQKIDGISPVFSNISQHYTTGVSIGEMFFDNADYQPVNWAAPASVIKDVYAVFIGGNSYYHEFLILSEEDVMEITPELMSTEFTAPQTTAYNVGDEFVLDGAKITYTYDYADPKTVDVTMDMLDQSTLPNMSEKGEYIVKGSHEGYEFSFTVTVTDKVVSGISLDGTLPETEFHLRDGYKTVFDQLTAMEIKVDYSSGESDYLPITENMLTTSQEWGLGERTITVTYLGKTCEVKVTVANLGTGIDEIKQKPAGEEVFDVYGVVISSAFISGTTASPARGELLLKDSTGNGVIGLKGLPISYTDKLAGLNVGDEILVQVKVVVTTTNDKTSECGKLALEKVADSEVIVLSKGNDTMLDTSDAVEISNQQQLNEFLASDEVRIENAYKLVKLSAGSKIVNYNATSISAYITFDGTNVTSSKVDGLAPYLSEMNEKMTLDEGQSYLDLLFGGQVGFNNSFTEPNVLPQDVYLMYIGGQGIYYHQFILLGEEYVSDQPTVVDVTVTPPTKADYTVGESLQLDGCKIVVRYYMDYLNQEITVEPSMVTAPETFEQAGTQTITVNYNGMQLTFEVNVTTKGVTSIELDGSLAKTEYLLSEGTQAVINELTAMELKVTYDDETFEFIPVDEKYIQAGEWIVGECTFVIQYAGKQLEVTVTVKDEVMSVDKFLQQESGTYKLTGIVVGPASSHAAAELLIKDKNSMSIVGVYNTGIVGAYNNLALDTSVVNVGDEVIFEATVKVGTSGVNVGKKYANVTSKENLLQSLTVVSSGNEITYTMSEASVTEISTQQQLVDFLNSPDRFYSYVKFSGLKAVYAGSKAKGFRLFFEGVTDLTSQKVNGSSPYLYEVNCNLYVEGGIAQYFTNADSTDYLNPATANTDIYALFVGGNNHYHDFITLDATYFVA